MAGKNKRFPAGKVLFRQGDKASSMYLIRKGKLTVYLEQDKKDLVLAHLEPGSIVGEMAFFDEKPRSASVKTAEVTDVTEISKADFDKLLTQVPKWMVLMMQNLTSRLRQTNAKVQDLEEKLLEIDPSATGSTVLPFQKFPFQHSLCFGRVLMFTLKNDGEKSGTEYVISFEGTRELWNELYPARTDLFNILVAAYTEAGFISKRKQHIVFHNKGQLANFINFASNFSHQFDIKNPYLTKEAMSLFSGLVSEVQNSGYENYSVNLKEFIASKKATHEDAPLWGKAAAELKKIPLVKLAKSGNDIQVKLNNREHSKILGHIKTLDTLRASKVI